MHHNFWFSRESRERCSSCRINLTAINVVSGKYQNRSCFKCNLVHGGPRNDELRDGKRLPNLSMVSQALYQGWSPEEKILNGSSHLGTIGQRQDLRHQVLEPSPMEIWNISRVRSEPAEIDLFAPQRNPVFPTASEKGLGTCVDLEGLGHVATPLGGQQYHGCTHSCQGCPVDADVQCCSQCGLGRIHGCAECGERCRSHFVHRIPRRVYSGLHIRNSETERGAFDTDICETEIASWESESPSSIEDEIVSKGNDARNTVDEENWEWFRQSFLV
jgi:hypothetical protein